MTMPNFLIIGANKAGTTSLYRYLNQHPQVYMSPVKEPMFFTLDGNLPDRNEPSHQITLKEAVSNIEDYRALFQNVSDQRAIGEASTSYLHCPWSAENIKRYIPDVKLIAILRDPIQRAYSNYLMYVRWGLETLSFAQAVRKEENRIRNDYPMGWHYVRLGFYYEPLKHYFDLFDPAQIRVYLYEDWNIKPAEVIKDIFRFIDVNDTFVPDMSVRHNVSVMPQDKLPPKNKALHAFLTTPNPIKSLLRPLLPARVRQPIVAALKGQNLVKPSLSLEMRRRLIEMYREDILKLQDLIQRDLSPWLDQCWKTS